MKQILFAVLLCAVLVAIPGCGRFSNPPTDSKDARYVVISPIYNEIIWALGAQDKVVGVDLSSTYPAEVKNVQTVGYHRALSAEGILSLHPTTILSSDDNIGPPQVVEQIKQLDHGRVVATGTAADVLTAGHITEVFGVEPTFIPVEHSGVHFVFD